MLSFFVMCWLTDVQSIDFWPNDLVPNFPYFLNIQNPLQTDLLEPWVGINKATKGVLCHRKRFFVAKNEYDQIIQSTLFSALHRITDPSILQGNDFYTQRQAETISYNVAIPSPNCLIIKHFSFSRCRNVSFMM